MCVHAYMCMCMCNERETLLHVASWQEFGMQKSVDNWSSWMLFDGHLSAVISLPINRNITFFFVQVANRQVVDFDSMSFKQGGHFKSNKTTGLPEGSFR